MKKFFLLLALVVAIGVNAQLRVANLSGQDLKISVGNKSQSVSNQALVTFADVRLKEVWLSCQTVAGETYTFLKKVSRKGYVEVSAEDISANNQKQIKTVVVETKRDTVPPPAASPVRISDIVKQKK